MQQRKLGGLTVPPLGLGCMGMSITYGERDDDESIRTIHRALELGCNFLDTSDAYGSGRNEELLAKALEGKRDKAILATKFGNVRIGDERKIIGKPEYVIEACEKSLQRLGTDYIDLFYQHRVDPTVPIEDTLGAMAKLVEQGKVGHLGLSEAGADTIRRAHATHPIAALQTEYSLWSRDVEAEILPTCRELGIGFVPYAPMGRGFLTGTIKSTDDLIEKDGRRRHPRFKDENMAQNAKLIETLTGIAGRLGATAAQVAIAWDLAQDDDIVPIPGTKRRSYLEENWAAKDLTLSDDDLAALAAAFQPGVTAGTRYPEKQLASLGI